MKSLIDIARQFSSGEFDGIEKHLAPEVEFHIFEDDTHLIGKDQVLEFCGKIASYFASIETDFRVSGEVSDGQRVVIYGLGYFKRNGLLLNVVNSCDVYEFKPDGQVLRINSYCNSHKRADT